MEDEVRSLVEMFPGLREEAAFDVLQSCEGDLTVAVDEALTMASLGTFNESGHPSAGSPPQLWRDGSFSYSASASYDNGEATLPARPARDGVSEETHRPVTVPTAPPLLCDSDAGWASENGRQKLPLDSDKRRYVMGSGELDLLAEVQMPRRGAAVVLPSDFLRVPGAVTATVAAVAPAPDFEELGDRKGTSGKDTTAEPLIDLDFDDGFGGSGGDRDHEQGKLVPAIMPVTRDAREGSTKFFGRHPLEDAESADAQSDRGEEDSPRLSWEGSSSNSDHEEEAVAGKTTSSSERSYPLANGASWKRTKTKAALDVVTASAVERIAAFQPGTRFRVAVDKGVTGLGITVKEIQGRFFIYRLQTLPDGSPGAAEEAGIKVGDELLGVEELDFERERWRMDQLVSYMRDLMGVVILYVMRGPARLPLASMMDGESGMNHEMMKSLENGGGEGGAAGHSERDGDGEGSGGRGVVDKRTRRLIEVLQEEKLLRPAEAEDVSRLFCQISERAREWDSGELWLWVADTDRRRRPSREVIAALADQWKPGEPPGWEVSDSSDDDGDSSDHYYPSNATLTSTRNDRGNGDRLGGRPRGEENDPAADLNKIGTALLGRPLFCGDPLSVEEQEVDSGGDGDGSQAGAGIVGAWTGRRSSADGHGGCGDCGGGRYWSPWPKLAALEKEGKHSQRGAVVPTRGLRKALNVRVLGEEELLGDKARPAGVKKSAGRSKSSAYVLWVMDVESGAEWRVRRCHAEFDELREVCTGLRPSLGRLDFPVRLDVKKTKGERKIVNETPGIVAARRPRFEAYLQRLCSLLYVGPLHPSSAHLAHVLQDFLGTSSRVETLERLQRSRPEREIRQALQVRAWQVLRLPPLERAVADFVKEVLEGPVPRSGSSSSSSKRGLSAEAILKKLTEIMERLQYVIAEGCFDDLREMVRVSKARSTAMSLGRTAFDVDGVEDSPSAKRRSRSGSNMNPFGPDDDHAEEDDGRKRRGDGVGDPPDLDSMAEEDEALELISESVRRQVEAEVFVPVMGRLYELLRTQGPTAQLEKTVAAGLAITKGKPQIFHGIPITSLSPSSWHSVTKLLHVMGSFTLPCDKLDTLVAVAHAIPALYRLEHQEEDVESLGADDFLPIFIFVLVNSGVERVAAQALVVETLCDPKRIMGEAGFCVATLSAALQHLARAAKGDQSRKSPLYSFLGRRA